MRRIVLGNGKAAKISTKDYARVSQFHWSYSRQGGHAYRYEMVNGKRRWIYMHRFVLGVVDPAVEVDHKDRDGLNNVRGNLRVCQHSHNGKNRSKSKNNTSGYKGVTFRRSTGRWIAQIKVEYRQIHIGVFDSAKKAAKAYDKKARKFFGEFAATNFPLRRDDQ